MNYRVGIGFDVHQLVANRALILGGVEIVHEFGLLGHSDADVLLHAISDALLGAAALGDIGQHFPDNDDAYKEISSMILLEHVVKLLEKDGYQINNIDCTIMAEKPKLMPHIPFMQDNIAKVCNMSTSAVNIKATTTEKLGFVGRQEGIAAQAIVSLIKLD